MSFPLVPGNAHEVAPPWQWTDGLGLMSGRSGRVEAAQRHVWLATAGHKTTADGVSGLSWSQARAGRHSASLTRGIGLPFVDSRVFDGGDTAIVNRSPRPSKN